MTYSPKRWKTLSLGAALLTSTALSGCGGEGEAGEGEGGEGAIHGEAGEAVGAGERGEGVGGEGEGGEAGHDQADLAIEKRVAFMRGHVAAGIDLYRAGKLEMAAPHLLHPVSEAYADERAGLNALGFDPSAFEAVSAALAEGKPAAEIEPQLRVAEENLAAVAAKAGGDGAELINYLLDTAQSEYAVGVVAGVIADAGEYQDAYGFVKTALAIANELEGDAAIRVSEELANLMAKWPDGPVPTDGPVPLSEVASQIALVKLELSGL